MLFSLRSIYIYNWCIPQSFTGFFVIYFVAISYKERILNHFSSAD